jgi:hypothetical protein
MPTLHRVNLRYLRSLAQRRLGKAAVEGREALERKKALAEASSNEFQRHVPKNTMIALSPPTDSRYQFSKEGDS